MEELLNRFFDNEDVLNALIYDRFDGLNDSIEWLKNQNYYEDERKYAIEYYYSLKNIRVTSLYELEDISKKIDLIEQIYDKVLRKVHRYKEAMILADTVNAIQNDFKANLTDEEITTIALFKKQLETITPTTDFNVEDVERMKEYINNISAKLYTQQLTDPKSFMNGNPFMFVVHNLTSHTDIKVTDEFYRKNFLSGSLITDKEMGLYGRNKVGFIYPVENNLLAADSKDIQSYNKDNDHSLEFIGQYDTPMIKPPLHVEQECMQKTISETGEILNYGENSNVYNEVVLDIRNKKPSGIFCITNGEKGLNSNYIAAVKLAEEFQLPLIDIDMSIYRSMNGLEPLTVSEQKKMTENILYLYDKDTYYDLGFRKNVAEAYYQQIYSNFITLKSNNQYSEETMLRVIDNIIHHRNINDTNLDEISEDVHKKR